MNLFPDFCIGFIVWAEKDNVVLPCAICDTIEQAQEELAKIVNVHSKGVDEISL